MSTIGFHHRLPHLPLRPDIKNEPGFCFLKKTGSGFIKGKTCASPDDRLAKEPTHSQ